MAHRVRLTTTTKAPFQGLSSLSTAEDIATPFDATGPLHAPETHPAGAALAAARKAPPPVPPRIPEADYVRAVAAWLKGEPWPFDYAVFRPYHGLSVRLVQEDDELLCEGVAIITRDPPSLMRLPAGTKTTVRTEARALCAVALRGYVWRHR